MDTSLGLSVLGIHHLQNIEIECRTTNEPYKWPELRPWMVERKWWPEPMFTYGRWYPQGHHEGFSWYDQGQRHIVDGMSFRGCENATGLFVIFSGGDRAHTQVMMASRNVAYLDANGLATRPPENAVWWMQPKDTPCTWDPNRTIVQTQWLQQSWIDLDGTASGRGVPTLMGSALAGNFWRLDAGCERRWDLWLCDLHGERWPVSMQLRWIIEPSWWSYPGIGTNICGGSLWGCRPLTPCPQLGYVTHFGRPAGHQLSAERRRLALVGDEGVPITPNGGITGPAGGLGWFINFFAGAPIEMNVTNVQMPDEATQLVVAIQYPPGSSFIVESRGASWCTNKYATWSRGGPPYPHITTCAWAHTAVSSVQQVRDGRGDEFYFDGTHLYVRAMPTSSYFDLATVPGLTASQRSFEWNGSVLLSAAERAFPYTFTRSGVSLIRAQCSEPTAMCGSHVHIKADCTPSHGGSAYCNQTQPVVVPNACDNASMTLAPGSFDTCVHRPPSPPPPPASPLPAPPFPGAGVGAIASIVAMHAATAMWMAV